MLGQVLRGVLMTAVSAGLHYYVWRRVVRDARPAPAVRRAATALVIALFLAVPVTTMGRLGWPRVSATVGWVAMPWLALVGLTAAALLALELVGAGLAGGAWVRRRLGGARGGRAARDGRGPGADASASPAPPADLGRREFLARCSGGAVATVAGAGVSLGMVAARGEHEIVEVEVELARLPAALDGFSIALLSDLHVGLTIDRAFVERVVARTRALDPDLVVLTGDLVDGRVEDLRDEIAPLAALRARHGVYAVTGNHEYYAGADPWIAALEAMGIRYLRNDRVLIGGEGAGFDLAGIDDHGAAAYPGHGPDLARALAGRDPSRAVVLLAHQPRQVASAAAHGVDLQLSGHTHGGQIWPWHYLVRLQQGGLLAGRYQVGPTQLYVTRGCGYWGPPVRLGAPLEITRIVLRAPGRRAAA